MFIWKPWLSLLLSFFYFSFWPQAFIRLVQIHALTPCWGYSACYLSLSFCLKVNALMNISWPLSTYHVSGLFQFSYCIERAALRSVSFWAFFPPRTSHDSLSHILPTTTAGFFGLPFWHQYRRTIWVKKTQAVLMIKENFKERFAFMILQHNFISSLWNVTVK